MMSESKPEYPKYSVQGDWIVCETGDCTCGSLGGYPHEPYCGLEPVVKIERLEKVLALESKLITLLADEVYIRKVNSEAGWPSPGERERTLYERLRGLVDDAR